MATPSIETQATVPNSRVALLGAPVLERQGGSLPFTRERRFQLLAVLAHHGDWISRERLATLLWPDLQPERARRNLRKVLHAVRELELSPGIEDLNGALRWKVATDLQAFEAALAAGDLASAVKHWRGEPWHGLDGDDTDGFDEWLTYERQRLHSRWRDALLRLCEQASDPAELLAWSERLLAHDPLDEEAVQFKMQACGRAGRAADATRTYHAFERTLSNTVGLVPSVRTGQLLRSLQPGAPPLRDLSPEPVRTLGEADFTGRQVEQHEFAALIARENCRWITLLGPGGIGKTRFLAHVLPSVEAQFADGVLRVSLEGLHDAGEVLPHLARRLDLTPDSATDAPERLRQALAQSQRLIALDNIEHVRDAAPALHALLAACPGLRMVVTSRERLGVPGEWSMTLEGLPYPEPDDVDRAEAFDAVRLFVRKALVNAPDFDFARQRDDVAALCRFVEGMPLALELAAAWARHFSVGEILRDLKAGGAMLSETQPAREPRQQSIVATFTHSWNLLIHAEREALMRMAVFRGGFTPEAAQHVAAATLSVLAALVDKSLVRSTRLNGVARFSLHPLLQQFALTHLQEHAATHERTRDAHANHYCRLLGTYQGGIWSEDWCGQTDAEPENIIDAWYRAVARRDRSLLALGVHGLALHCYRLGRWEQAVSAYESAEPVLAAVPREHAELCCRLAQFRLYIYDYRGAEQSALTALRTFRRTKNLTMRHHCHYVLSITRQNAGQFELAERGLRQGMELERAAGGGGGARKFSISWSGLIDVMRVRGRYEEALAFAHTAPASLWNGMGARMADLHRLAGRPAQGLALLEPMLRTVSTPAGDTFSSEYRWEAAQTAAACHFDLGAIDQAERYLAIAQAAQSEGRGSVPVWRYATTTLRARIACRKRRFGTAHDLLVEANTITQRGGYMPAQLAVAAHWAELALALGHPGICARIAAAVKQAAPTEMPTREFATLLQQQAGAAAAFLPRDASGSIDLNRYAEAIGALLDPSAAPAHGRAGRETSAPAARPAARTDAPHGDRPDAIGLPEADAAR